MIKEKRATPSTLVFTNKLMTVKKVIVCDNGTGVILIRESDFY